jgi:hypothetical protein
MRVRSAVVALFVVGFVGASSAPVRAQQQGLVTADAIASAQSDAVLRSEQSAAPQVAAPRTRPYFRVEKRPVWTVPMHVVTATMQGLDAHSTFRAFDVGAVEANPLVSSFAHHRPAFAAFKVGVAAGIIYATDRLAKRHPIRALIASTAINSAYAMIAARNYQVARGVR